MARNKSYDNSKDYIVDKDVAIPAVEEELLNFVLNMFDYKNLPDTIPKYNLEKYLMTLGYCGVTKVGDELYAIDGTLGGKPNAYHEPTQFIYANEVLGSATVDEDSYVLCKNDFRKQGLMPIINRYTNFMVESNITMRTVLLTTRMNILVSASDERTKASAESYLRKIENGQLGVIGESAFFDGVRMQTASTTSNYVTQVVEMMQFIKGSFLQAIGVNSPHNMKSEYVNKDETGLNDDGLRPLVDNMLECRKQFVDEINEMFGTEIEVDFNSVWKRKQVEQGLSSQLEKGESDVVESNEEQPTVEESDEGDEDEHISGVDGSIEDGEHDAESGNSDGADNKGIDDSDGDGSRTSEGSEGTSDGDSTSEDKSEESSQLDEEDIDDDESESSASENEESSQLDEEDSEDDESKSESSTSENEESDEEDEGRQTDDVSSESDEEKKP